ncbi:unnamed protein product [Protopolystoma xenopodis]|uniref:Secreted protein n=1 Tax=Protopolystoma xenopodis TaxID=117903 RepID=A0A3S5CIC6_9PLAT|nr:unnamed protein product [Protopolystoma xenopodis]
MRVRLLVGMLCLHSLCSSPTANAVCPTDEPVTCAAVRTTGSAADLHDDTGELSEPQRCIQLASITRVSASPSGEYR